MSDSNYPPPLPAPTTRPRVVLDTDAFNEIDDQFAIAYLLFDVSGRACYFTTYPPRLKRW